MIIDNFHEHKPVLEMRSKNANTTSRYFTNNYWGDAHCFDHVVVISGYPVCPVCFHQYLTLRDFQEGECYWYCNEDAGGCGTEWDVLDLVEAMDMITEDE